MTSVFNMMGYQLEYCQVSQGLLARIELSMNYTAATRTFFALGGSHFSMTPGDYIKTLFFPYLSGHYYAWLLFSPMLVSCRQ